MADQPGYVGLQGTKKGAPLYGGVPIGGGNTFNSGTDILNHYGIGGQAYGTGLAGAPPLPTDPVTVGARALGAPTVGHDLGRFPTYATYNQAQNLPAQWYSNDRKFYDQFLTKAIMYKVGGASSDMGLPEVSNLWDGLLQQAIQLNKADPSKNWTPWDILETYNRKPGSLGTHKVGDFLVDNVTGEKVKYVGPKTKTTKQTTIDLSSPEDVQAIANQVLGQMLGRAPTDKEMAMFKSSLNGYEQKHPDVATTTTSYGDMGEEVSSSTVHTGGVDDAARQAVLSSQVKGTKDFAKYQSGTTYFNALMAMMTGG